MPIVRDNAFDFGNKARIMRRVRYKPSTKVKNSRDRRLAQRVSKYIGEPKYHISAPGATNISTVGTIMNLTEVAQVTGGASDTLRIGDRVTLMNIEFRYILTANLASVSLSDNYNNIRVILFQWKPISATATPPTVAKLLHSANVIAPFTHDTSSQYKILMDKMHTLTAYNTGTLIAANANSTLIRRKFIKQSRLNKTMYFQAGGLESSNHVYVLFISDSSAVNHPTIEFYSRMNFRDA